MGYKKDSDETEEQFHERMSGMVAFFAALCQTNLEPFHSQNTAFPHSMGWSWLARFLNMPPRRISADLVCSFLKIAGWAYGRTYGQQARKIIVYLRREYITRIQGAGTDGGKIRMELLLDNIEKGHLAQHEGHELRR